MLISMATGYWRSFFRDEPPRLSVRAMLSTVRRDWVELDSGVSEKGKVKNQVNADSNPITDHQKVQCVVTLCTWSFSTCEAGSR